MHVLHLLANQRPHHIQFFSRNFKHKFVVDLQGHARFQFPLTESGVNANHGDLNEIGGGALQRRVDGGALGESAKVGIFAVDVGNGADATEESFDFAFAADFFERGVNEFAHAGIFFEISVNELLAFGGRDAETLCKSASGEAVDDAEVDDFGLAAMIRRDHQRRHAEDLRSGERVNVVTASVGFEQQRVTGIVRQQAQFNLRIVGGEQHMAGFGGERRANFATEFGADGNVLQIGVGGVETAGGGS